jgi:hypothetical protein
MTQTPSKREGEGLIRDHVFKPGDRKSGWELQCSVAARVWEGEWVRAHCGSPPEMHLPTSDPIHAEDCVAWTKDNGCDCWASCVAALSAEGGET